MQIGVPDLPDVGEFWNCQIPEPGVSWRNLATTDQDVAALLHRRDANGLNLTVVRDLFRTSPRRAVLGVAMWGYPTDPRGRLPATCSQAEAIADVLEALARRTLPAQTLLSVLLGFKDLGPSTVSKLLFVRGVESAEGLCLVYDQRVVRAIAECEDEEFSELKTRAMAAANNSYPESSIHGLQTRSYSQYLAALHAVAIRLQCEPLQAEQFLFRYGRPAGAQGG
jgi:hypothetical protein